MNGRAKSSYYGKGADFDENISVVINGYYRNGLNYGTWTIERSCKSTTEVIFPTGRNGYNKETVISVIENNKTEYKTVGELTHEVGWISSHPHDQLFFR